MTVKESFKKFFIEFTQENFAQVTGENALTIYIAGDKNGRKRTLEDVRDKLLRYISNKPQTAVHIEYFRGLSHKQSIKYIDTELKNLEGE